jgi:hypothetical protein
MGNLTVSAPACTWFLLGAFVLAGMAQTAWFATPLSRRFSRPIDGGQCSAGDVSSATTRRFADSSS